MWNSFIWFRQSRRSGKLEAILITYIRTEIPCPTSVGQAQVALTPKLRILNATKNDNGVTIIALSCTTHGQSIHIKTESGPEKKHLQDLENSRCKKRLGIGRERQKNSLNTEYVGTFTRNKISDKTEKTSIISWPQHDRNTQSNKLRGGTVHASAIPNRGKTL